MESGLGPLAGGSHLGGRHPRTRHNVGNTAMKEPSSSQTAGMSRAASQLSGIDWACRGPDLSESTHSKCKPGLLGVGNTPARSVLDLEQFGVWGARPKLGGARAPSHKLQVLTPTRSHVPPTLFPCPTSLTRDVPMLG